MLRGVRPAYAQGASAGKRKGKVMKKSFLIFLLMLIITSGLTIRTIRIGMDLRMLHIYTDEKGLHHVYYTEPGNGKSPVLLGEEIFYKGEKLFDTFREND
jgi:hypothetical protein